MNSEGLMPSSLPFFPLAPGVGQLSNYEGSFYGVSRVEIKLLRFEIENLRFEMQI
jgi:hypothetical protein